MGAVVSEVPVFTKGHFGKLLTEEVRILPEEPPKLGISNLRFTGDPNSTLELVGLQGVRSLDELFAVVRWRFLRPLSVACSASRYT